MSVEKLIDGWNARSGRAVADAFAPDGVRWELALPGARLEGREAIAAQAQAYIDAVPDCVLDVHALRFDDQGGAMLEWTFRGASAGAVPGLPGKGEPVELRGVAVYDLEGGRGGAIREERVYWDSATMQAGTAAAAAGAGATA
jgi:steroid delta-isomerase-like uncharacterized protein